MTRTSTTINGQPAIIETPYVDPVDQAFADATKLLFSDE